MTETDAIPRPEGQLGVDEKTHDTGQTTEKSTCELDSRLRDGEALAASEWEVPKSPEFDSRGYHCEVTNSEGYLCHISMKARIEMPPETVFAVLTNPNNTEVFRNIDGLRSRKVLEDDGRGNKVVDVEQIGSVRLLLWRMSFVTHLRVTESRDHLCTKFELLKQGQMKRFNGVWRMLPMPGNPEHTLSVLDQDVLPTITGAVPRPLHGLLKRICTGAVVRMLEDLREVARKLQNGIPLRQILTNDADNVQSHFVDEEHVDDEDEDGQEQPLPQHTEQELAVTLENTHLPAEAG